MADVARLSVIFAADTSAMDRGFARAKKAIADYQKQAAKSKDLALDADDTPLRAELAGAMKSVVAYQKAGTAAAEVKLDGDNSGLLRSIASSKAALSGLPNEKNVMVDVNTKGALKSLTGLTSSILGRGGVGLVGALGRAATVAHGTFALAIPAAIALSVAALQPLMGGAGIGGSAIAAVGAGFGLIALAARQTFDKIKLENGKFVADTDRTLTKSQRQIVGQLNKAADAYSRAFRPANDAFNAFAGQVVQVATQTFPRLGRAAEETTTAVGNAIRQITKALSAPSQLASYERFLNAVPSITAKFTRAAGNFFGGFANILSEAVPYARQFAGWVERISKDFLSWSQSEAGREDMREFFESAKDLAPKVAEAVGKIARGLLKISKDPDTQDALGGIVEDFGAIGDAAKEINRAADAIRQLNRWLNRANTASKDAGEAVNRFFGDNGPVQKAFDGAGRKINAFFKGVRKGFSNFLGFFGDSGPIQAAFDRFGQWWNRLWQRMADWVQKKRDGVMQTLGNWKEKAIAWVQNLSQTVSEKWTRFWQGVADWVQKKRDGVMQTLSNWKDRAVAWVSSLPQAIGEKWNKVWQGMADFVVKKKEGILQTVGNLKTGIVDGFSAIVGYINNVLKAVGLPTINVGGGDEQKAPKAEKTGPQGTGGTGSPMRAKGGYIDGRETVIVGDEGQREYVVNPSRPDNVRYLSEAARDMGYDVVPRSHRSRRGEADPHRAGRMMGYRSGRGEGLGPTNYSVVPEVKKMADAIASKTGTSWNSYAGHGEPGGSNEDWTVDFWGGSRGAPLSASQGFETARLALEAALTPLYMIRQGEYWRGGNWQPWPEDPHFDHTHVSWPIGGKGGGARGSGGGSTSLWDSIGAAMWENTVAGRVASLAGKLGGGGGVFGDIAAKLVTTTAEKIKSYIIEKAGSIGYSGPSGELGALGGTPEKNRQLGQKMFENSGLGGSWSSLDELWRRESGWNHLADNPTSSAYGIPQALTDLHNLPPGYGPPGGEPATQIDWGLNYIRDRYSTTDAALSYHDRYNSYARGGVHKPRLGMSGRMEAAFKTVADALNRMVGGKENGALRSETGRGQITQGITGIAGEAGVESIVPLERKTPEGEHALRTAMRVHHPEVRMFADGGLSGYVSRAKSAWGNFGEHIDRPFVFTALPSGILGRTGPSQTGINQSAWAYMTENARLAVVAHEGGHQIGIHQHLGAGNLMQPNFYSRGNNNPTSPTQADLSAASSVTGLKPSDPQTVGEPTGGGRPLPTGGTTSGTSITQTGTGPQSTIQRQGSGGNSLPSGLFGGRTGGSASGGTEAGADIKGIRNAANAQLKEIRRMVRELENLPGEIREGVMHNLARGNRTGAALGRGMERFGERQQMGGPALSRAR